MVASVIGVLPVVQMTMASDGQIHERTRKTAAELRLVHDLAGCQTTNGRKSAINDLLITMQTEYDIPTVCICFTVHIQSCTWNY